VLQDIHKIDSAVFKPDPTREKSNREGGSGKRRAASEKNSKSLPEAAADEMQRTDTDEDHKEHPFLDVRV
jgi:hypothetical protein